jgi:uncharacterized protein YhbP (UPF0306 family)
VTLTANIVSAQAEDEVKASVQELLDKNGLCSWATVAPDGTAHINASYFASSPELELFIFTEPSSRHGQNVSRNPSSAVTVFDSHQPWGGDVYGVQLFGTASLLGGEAAEAALAVYADRHPGMKSWATSMAEVEISFDSRFYGIRVERFTLLDYPRFGPEVYVNGLVKRGT